MYGVHKLLKVSLDGCVMYRLFSMVCVSLNCCLKMSSLGSLSCSLHLYMYHLPVIMSRSITLSVITFLFVPKMISCSDRDRLSQLGTVVFNPVCHFIPELMDFMAGKKQMHYGFFFITSECAEWVIFKFSNV